jgi:hypothetical protein
VTEEGDRLREAMKRVAVTLKRAEVPFALAGGFAGYARGGPEPGHDVDFYLLEADVPRAQRALDEAGLRLEDPPEDWLVKVYDGEAMVDLIFAPKAGPVEKELLNRAGELEVDSVLMPVLSPTDLLVDKLLALDERSCDYARLFPVVRSLREQVDWAEVRQRTADNPFARAFLSLADTLSITD